jgi:hypothetical protein
MMIFNYFSRGLSNYEIKYSEFLYHFIIELTLDDHRANHIVFKILDENKDGLLQILDILRLYVNVPARSAFANELR